MAVRRIIQLSGASPPSPEDTLLTSVTRPVSEFGAALQPLVDDLVETMSAHAICVGLAAPQIGVDLSVAVAKVADDEVLVLVNPVIRSATGKKDVKRESCMSLWGRAGLVERREKVEVEFADVFGVREVRSFRSFPARVVQHEVDHLNGVVYQSYVEGELELTELFAGDSPDGTDQDAKESG